MSLEYYMRQVYDYKPLFRSRLPQGEIFGSSPRLDSTRTNRILIYPGSFNPPHRGHMQLLKHVFLHGCHDLNVIAAIILPRIDSSLLSKCEEAGATFMFGKDERCLLWKQDIAFPEWAWVYEDDNFHTFQRQLKRAMGDDGYRTDFVMLYGPDIASPIHPPTGSHHPYETMIMSNAARDAHYQRSSGRLRDFNHCTRWQPVHVDMERLERWAGLKAIHRLLDMHSMCPKEAERMMEDGPEYVVRTIMEIVAEAVKDLGQGNVLYCRRQLEDRKLTVRFVKGESTELQEAKEISSSRVRAVMHTQHRDCQREALELIALSSHILWRYRSSWGEKARCGASECVSFPPVSEDDSGLLYNLSEDSENDSKDDSKGMNGVERKRQCLLATRQGVSSFVGIPPACKDDLELDRMKLESDRKQPSTRRNSW